MVFEAIAEKNYAVCYTKCCKRHILCCLQQNCLNVLFQLKELSKEIISTAPRPSEEEPTEKVKKAQEKKSTKKTIKDKNKASSQSFISYGKKKISIPAHTKRVTKALKFVPHYSIKNPKTKRAFMYSSPWAAVKSLRLHKNESFDHLAPYPATDRGKCFTVRYLMSGCSSSSLSLLYLDRSIVRGKGFFLSP